MNSVFFVSHFFTRVLKKALSNQKLTVLKNKMSFGNGLCRYTLVFQRSKSRIYILYLYNEFYTCTRRYRSPLVVFKKSIYC